MASPAFDEAFSSLFGTSSGAGVTGIASPMDLRMFDSLGGDSSLGSPLDLSGILGRTGSLSHVFPGAAGGDNGLFGTGIGIDDAKIGLAGLNTIGGLWSAFEARNLAKKQFGFQKDFAEKNYANQLQSYNTALEDRSRSRAVAEGQSAETAADYIKRNKLG